MASSSSSSVKQKHQVFLSFRGEDTRNNFTSHLHVALERNEIDTFIDDQLTRGEEISQALLTVIKESKISIIVLSKNYASSSWCLNELLEILDCRRTKGQIVVPIFYHVDPSDVRKQIGSFAKAFAEHGKKSANKVERWSAALEEVANLSGWHLDSKKDCTEAEVIQIIVEFIWRELKCELSGDFEGLVGMESCIEELEELLPTELDGVRIIGIWGMPGVGKTTTAEVFFKRISSQFAASYFLANVREKSASRQVLECVRNELFSEILKKKVTIPTPSIKGTFVMRWVHRRKVLIVLDDVDNSVQVEYLIEDGSCFGPGSLIIITSRDRKVLEKAHTIYEVEKLNFELAPKLFFQFAFGDNHCIEERMRLSIRVLRYADGIPLALKILGSSLKGESESTWESALEELVKAPNRKIEDVFRISYDGLQPKEKEIFLDVACFFKGEDRNRVTNILGGCGLSIKVLINKSLITISEEKLQMHDLIQEMGLKTVCQESEHPANRSRLWSYNDIIDVLRTNMVTNTVKGIFLDMSKIEEMCINHQAFEHMRELRLLKIYNPHSQKECKVHLPFGLQIHSKKLAYLHWHCYPLESLPLSFDPNNLVELHMHYSCVNQLWKGNRMLSCLKRIDLSYSQCLKEIPNLSTASNLEQIHLLGCKSLLEIPTTGPSLTKLKAVYLSGCSNLQKFPFLSKDVEELHLDGTAIEEVPTSIQCLSKLVKLNMKNCKRLKNLPNIHPKLKSLECLDLSGCSSLMKFPEISCNLKELLLDESAIEELSSFIEFLDKLTSLKLQNCTRLKYLPSCICELKSLKFLDLSGCSNLTKFAKIPDNVENIYLGGTAIEQLPSTSGCLSKLVLLDLKNCTGLECLPRSICDLKSLQELNLSGCTKFASFPEILEPMEGLKNLYLDGTSIKELPESIEHLRGLFSLELQNCKNLESLPNSTCKLKFLENLNLCGCSRLAKLPDNLGSLESLKVLKASGCKGEDSVGLLLPRLRGLSSLEILHLSDCGLQDFPHDIIWMSSLEELDLSQNKFQSIPADLKQGPAVKFLHLSYCKGFRCLPELPSDLMKLDVHGCTALEEVSNIKLPQSYSSNGDHFVFTSCSKLNQNACRNIETSALERIQHMESFLVNQLDICSRDAYRHCFLTATNVSAMSLIGIRPCAVFCFPGVNIPEWFDPQNDGSSVTVQLPPHLVQFALCAVIAFKDYSDDGEFKVRCEVRSKISNEGKSHQTYHLKGWSGQKGKPRSVMSDHVFMWYDSSLILDKVEGDNWYSQDFGKVSIRVFPVDQDDNPSRCCKVKRCGVRIFSEIGEKIAALNKMLCLGKHGEGGSSVQMSDNRDVLKDTQKSVDPSWVPEDDILGRHPGQGVIEQRNWWGCPFNDPRQVSNGLGFGEAVALNKTNDGLCSNYVNMDLDMGKSESIPLGTSLILPETKKEAAESSGQARGVSSIQVGNATIDKFEARGKRVRETESQMQRKKIGGM